MSTKVMAIHILYHILYLVKEYVILKEAVAMIRIA